MKEIDDSIAFEGSTLEEAYKKASLEFGCSITDLKSEVLQAPSNGFLGLFKKNAIIKVYECKKKSKNTEQKRENNINIKDVSSELEEIHNEPCEQSVKSVKQKKKKDNKIFDDFYSNDAPQEEISPVIQNDAILDEIREDINKLFSTLPYQIEPIKVEYYDEKTLYIEFNGDDSALLIGKEGYRYKALSYILFNWIHDKYNLMIRLEIAQFLVSQEEAIHKYLEPVIETIKVEGFYKTKPLDGILVHIALTKLRDEFPDKYVAVKSNIKGDKYILVNEYRK
jgi:spoIIIJ-associated protein